jgi:hypothetical protein
MLETLRGTDGVLPEPAPEVLVMDLAESAVNIRLRWWVQPPRQYDVLASRDAVLERVKGALQQAGIDLPFPTRQMLFHDQTEDSDGDRARQREGWPADGNKAPEQGGIARALRTVRTGSPQKEDGRDKAQNGGQRAENPPENRAEKA